MSDVQVTAASELRSQELQIRELPGSLSRIADFAEAVGSLQGGSAATFDGVWGASSALLATALGEQATQPLVVVPVKMSESAFILLR